LIVVTDHYAVVGNPIAHSRSPEIHAAFARQTGQHLIYAALLAPADGFREVMEAFRAGGGLGMNVTIPFKQQAFEASTQLSERARQARAVNTLRFIEEEIVGDNTDGAGLKADLTRNLGLDLAGRRILVMGAGGAVRGVLPALLEAGPSHLFIANRTAERAVALADELSAPGPVAGGGYDAIGRQSFDLVLNGTAASLAKELPPLPGTVFATGALAYDMMYGRDTPFLAFARRHGARTSDGLGMLVEQAAEAFWVWRGVRPVTAPVIAMLRDRRPG
jgi:shikimate dehydrogenase